MDTYPHPTPHPHPPPRYFPQIPFPHYCYLPGKTPHPIHRDEPWVDESLLEMEVSENLLAHPRFYFGIDLFNNAYWWESHECWEVLWLLLDEPTKNFMQCLIQMGACCLVKYLGRTRGTESLKKQVTRRVEMHLEHPHRQDYGIQFSSLFTNFVAYIEDKGPPPLIELRTPLTTSSHQNSGE